MKNNEKNLKLTTLGFTLIELLAVIIILAVIALIATPIVLDVVESSKKSAFESTAYGVIDAVKLKTMEDRLEGTTLSGEYTFPSEEIEVQGKEPNGSIVVDNEGRIAIALYDGKWCATKSYLEGTVNIKEYVEGECELPFVMLGDVNGDGEITNADILMLKQVLGGMEDSLLEKFNIEDKNMLYSRCDLNRDDVLNQIDLDELKKCALDNCSIENIMKFIPINPNITVEYTE